MRILRTMKPGAKGTQSLADEFGARLVCVRYRYDAGTKKRYTTAEIVVAEGNWEPKRGEPEAHESAWVRIRWDEKELRVRVKEAGGRWDVERKLWELPAGKARELNLQSRVVRAAPDTEHQSPVPRQGV